MKGILMSATALSMKKMALAIFCVTLLMLVAAPAWADPCNAPTVGVPAGSVGSNDSTGSCGVVITITGTITVTSTGSTGQLVATISPGSNGSYDGQDDQLVGIINNSNVTVGAVTLNTPSDDDDSLFAFDGDGPCELAQHSPAYAWCPPGYPMTQNDPNPGGYQGPTNTFTRISADYTTGTVWFNPGLPAGKTTWFALEGAPANVTGIWQTLVAGQTSAFPFGSGGTDDFRLQPVNSSPGDAALVTPVPTAFSSIPGFASNFPSLVCVPYFDYRTEGGPQCVDLQLDCIGTDSCSFLYTTQLDYVIDGNPDAAPTLVGGPALLVQHDVNCPTGAYTDNIFLSYKGSNPGTDPPLVGGGKNGHSCYDAAFNPTAPPIPAGQTVSTFGGFEFPSNTKTNPVFQGLPVPLLWAFNDSSGNPVTKLTLCKNATGTGCTAPWVNLSLTAVTQTAPCLAIAAASSPSLPSVLNSGLVNLKKGQYGFAWNTLTNIKGLKGCQVRVVLQFNTGSTLLVSDPALFQYQL